MTKNVFMTIALLLSGTVVGSLVAEVSAKIPVLGWLTYSMTFGMPENLVIDISVLRLSFGISVELSVSVVLFCLLFLSIGFYLSKGKR